MQFSQNLRDLLTLNRLSLTGAKAVHDLLCGGLSPGELLRRISEENFLNKKEALKQLVPGFDAETEIKSAQQRGITFLTVLDAEYPKMLRMISDPPLVLYVLGNILSVDHAAAAIVGTRHPSLYGMTQAKKFSKGISEKGFTVVSGLAQGVDQIAHESALEIPYGRTIAVLGCGLDIDYPAGSKKLRESIAARGAVVTEYAFGTAPRAENFPRRNRIIAGLTLGVLVVEAHSRSGSLITARLAAEEGREVFAIPGAVDQLGSRGTNHLIKEGAQLVETPQEVIEVLGSLFSLQDRESSIKKCDLPLIMSEDARKDQGEGIETDLTEPEKQLMNLLRDEPLSGDEILEKVSSFPGAISTTLTILELKGRIRRESNGRFALRRVC